MAYHKIAAPDTKCIMNYTDIYNLYFTHGRDKKCI